MALFGFFFFFCIVSIWVFIVSMIVVVAVWFLLLLFHYYYYYYFAGFVILLLLFYFLLYLFLFIVALLGIIFLGYSACLLLMFVVYGDHFIFYLILNICNFSIMFFVALSWILFFWPINNFHLRIFPIALL